MCAGLGLRFMTPYEMLRVKSRSSFWEAEAVIEALHTAPVPPRPCTRLPAGRLPRRVRIARILWSNKTRQGYARERILKPAGYFCAPNQQRTESAFGRTMKRPSIQTCHHPRPR